MTKEMKELTKEEILDNSINSSPIRMRGDKQLILNAMQEYSDKNTKPLIQDIERYKKIITQPDWNELEYVVGLENRVQELTEENAKLKSSKSEANEAVEFAEWCQLNGWSYNSIHKDWFNTYLQPFKTTTELYEIFKTRKTK